MGLYRLITKSACRAVYDSGEEGKEACFSKQKRASIQKANCDEYAAETMYALIQTCDPSLTKDEAHAIGSEVIANYESLGSGKGMGQALKNGITYSIASSSGRIVSAKVG